MAKVFLDAGTRVCLRNATLRIGASGTVLDGVLDWTWMLTMAENNDPATAEIGESIGFLGSSVDGKNYEVFFDNATSRMYYDTEVFTFASATKPEK
jgi:hypothetical protein